MYVGVGERRGVGGGEVRCWAVAVRLGNGERSRFCVLRLTGADGQTRERDATMRKGGGLRDLGTD